MRKNLMLGLLIGFSSLSLVAMDADAKRMGGGKSIGRQSQPVEQRQAPAQPQSTAPQQQSAAPQQNASSTQTAAQPTAPAKKSNPMLGALGGIAAALGIAALLSHFGLAGAAAEFIGTLLLVLAVVAVGVFLFRRLRGQPAQPAYAGMGTPPQHPAAQPEASAPAAQLRESAAQPSYNPSLTAAANAMAEGKTLTDWSIPADMDVENFLHYSKVNFVRLQASWDSGNLEDIREFTSPAMFAELKLQLNERGERENITDVVSVEAELLGVEITPKEEIASVRYTGFMREGKDAAAEPFDEVWNLVRPASRKSGWVLAGIQHTSQ